MKLKQFNNTLLKWRDNFYYLNKSSDNLIYNLTKSQFEIVPYNFNYFEVIKCEVKSIEQAFDIYNSIMIFG